MNNLESEYRLPSDPVRLERDAFEEAIEAAQTTFEVLEQNTEILPVPEKRLAKILAFQDSIKESRERHIQKAKADRQAGRIYVLAGNILGRLIGFNPLTKRIPNLATLIDQESYIGGKHVFEPSTSTPGTEVERRFFFDYDYATGSNDWFFEEKTTTDKDTVIEDISYWFKVKQNQGVYLSRNDDGALQPVTGAELDEFGNAVEVYHELVHKHIYGSRSDYDLTA